MSLWHGGPTVPLELCDGDGCTWCAAVDSHRARLAGDLTAPRLLTFGAKASRRVLVRVKRAAWRWLQAMAEAA